jgi:hypothetical protein
MCQSGQYSEEYLNDMMLETMRMDEPAIRFQIIHVDRRQPTNEQI